MSVLSSYEKLSLKKTKETSHINRTQSYKRIVKGVPTTKRSEDGAEQYLLNLIKMKKQVENELNCLNQDFDICYNIYNKKIK
jgi:hypothetical protein